MNTRNDAARSFYRKILVLGSIIIAMTVIYGCQDFIFEPEPESTPEPEEQAEESSLKTAEIYTNGYASHGDLPSGAQYCISIPSNWNGELLVYAHGYVDPDQPISLPDDELGDGTKISELINQLGFGYASTSYRANGLVVKDAVFDILELMALIQSLPTQPNHIYLGGVSERALITVLTLEKHPQLLSPTPMLPSKY